ncbi:MAG: hypothetical protein H0T68_00280 [Gemmatimonadales bacterium]|nr:hypothetical protein [Gemmatimonadales bacterium]
MRGWWIPVLAVLAGCSDDDNGTGPDGDAPDTPAGLSSTSLDGAVALTWSDNSYQSDPTNFQNYRVYSTSYDLDVPPDADACGSDLVLEGTTVAPEFIVGAMTNGVPRCFEVTAVSVDGLESGRSLPQADTPRPDARNVALFTLQADPTESGFRFWDDLDGDGQADDGELGRVGDGGSSTLDFFVDRDVAGEVFLNPVRPGTGVEYYDEVPVEDLTSIDFAEERTYRTTGIEAEPGFGYVFETDGGDGFQRYGAVRVTHVGETFILLDWAFQTDPGNPELIVRGGVARR